VSSHPIYWVGCKQFLLILYTSQPNKLGDYIRQKMDKKKLATVFDTVSSDPNHTPRLAPKTRADLNEAQQEIWDYITSSERGVRVLLMLGFM